MFLDEIFSFGKFTGFPKEVVDNIMGLVKENIHC